MRAEVATSRSTVPAPAFPSTTTAPRPDRRASQHTLNAQHASQHAVNCPARTHSWELRKQEGEITEEWDSKGREDPGGQGEWLRDSGEFIRQGDPRGYEESLQNGESLSRRSSEHREASVRRKSSSSSSRAGSRRGNKKVWFPHHVKHKTPLRLRFIMYYYFVKRLIRCRATDDADRNIRRWLSRLFSGKGIHLD